MRAVVPVHASIALVGALVLAAGCSSFTYAPRDASSDTDAASADAAPVCAIEGQTFCAGTGCTNLQRDVDHCGACGHACSRRNGTPSCAAGVCVVSCSRGYSDCDRDVGNGCEVSLDTDAAHCGACGHACPTGGECRGGSCFCPTGQTACGEACIDTATNAAHCGACGHACRVDQLCAASACACPTGRTECGGACVDLMSDPAHCGACGLRCVTGASCNAGWCPATTQRSCATAGTPGCGLVEISHDIFAQGEDSTTPNGGQPRQPYIAVGDYAIDAYEVTVARFRLWWNVRAASLAAVRARPIAYPSGQTVAWEHMGSEPESGPGDRTWTPTPSTAESREEHPINFVDWWTAQEFCVWDGGRLPTEAEWELAAVRPPPMSITQRRPYPWGGEDPAFSPCDRAQWRACSGEDGVQTRRVGRFAPSMGLYDLIGNASEWTADAWSTYPLPAECGSTMTNPLCLRDTDYVTRYGRVVRGGDAYTTAVYRMHSAARVGLRGEEKWGEVGFRCARTRP